MTTGSAGTRSGPATGSNEGVMGDSGFDVATGSNVGAATSGGDGPAAAGDSSGKEVFDANEAGATGFRADGSGCSWAIESLATPVCFGDWPERTRARKAAGVSSPAPNCTLPARTSATLA